MVHRKLYQGWADTPELGRKGGSAGDDLTPPPPPPAPEPAAPEPPVGSQSYQPPPPAPGVSSRPRHPGATAGIVLVVLGVLFLAGQFVPALAWWNLWPLIIVIAGIVHAVTPGKDGWSAARLFDGLVTVAWGALFLAITTGVVGWGVFAVLLTLWPLLLIAIGFELLGKALHATWIRALGSLVIIGGLAFAVALSLTGSSWSLFPTQTTGKPAELSEPVGTVEEANLKLDAGAANVSLEAGDSLVEAEGESPWGTPEFSVERSGSTADVRLNSGNADGTTWWPGRSGSRIDAQLSSDVLWDMEITVGVADFTADLSEMQVRSLELKPGVADCDVSLGDPAIDLGESRAVIKAGVSTVRVRIPEDAEVRVESKSGLTAHDIGGGLESLGNGVWQTPDFEDARDSGEDVWVINLESGVGSVVVDSY